VFNREAPRWQWSEGSTPVIDTKMLKPLGWGFKTELLFFPLDFLVKTYPDEVWDNVLMMSKEKFFADRGLPIRQSGPEETNQMFGGEPQYLFLASPALTDAHFWFSAVNGQLRQIDIFLPEEEVKSFRYEDYVRKDGEDASFPRRFILTSKKGSGDQATGWEYVIELTDLEINIDIPAERFIPPQSGSSAP